MIIKPGRTRNISLVALISIALLCVSAAAFTDIAHAYWIWTPETKKFINPKYAVKDTPREQFDWAMSFYNAKDYARAAVEFEKLAKHFEFSEYASKAQYHAGLSYEDMGKPYIAFQAYQKAVDNFPHIENMEEIIEREFNIANLYAEKKSPKVLGTDIMTSAERAIEIYRKVVDNAPFGKLADEAQYRMGEVMKRAGRFEEATLAFQKIVDDYPTSRFADKAQYEVAQCAYRASLQPAYDVGPTDRALKIFEDYAATSQDEKLSKEALATIQRLKDKAAEKSMMTARFYEGQSHPVSAIIYYQDVLDRYPESMYAPEAKAKIELLEIKSSMKRAPSGKIFGWLTRPAAVEAPKAPKAPEVVVPKSTKSPWWSFGIFGKKTQAAVAAGAVSPASGPVAAVSAPQVVQAPVTASGVVPAPSQPAVSALPAPTPAKPAKKGWDFFGIFSTEQEAPPPPPPAIDMDAPVLVDQKGVSRSQPTGDDINVELDDDRI